MFGSGRFVVDGVAMRHGELEGGVREGAVGVRWGGEPRSRTKKKDVKSDLFEFNTENERARVEN